MAFGFHPRVVVADSELRRCLSFALEAAAEAGAATLAHFRNDPATHNKDTTGGFDPVTEADRAAEALIRERIRERFPAHGILGEEHGYEAGAGGEDGLTWVIDPIDGTRAFMSGMLHWGVLLALFDGEQPILGVAHQPFTDELFWGTNNRAEYRRGATQRTLRVRACAALADATLVSTGPQFFMPGAEANAFQAVSKAARMTRYGGDCYLYCMLAMGQLDLVVEAGLNPYDMQALMPIIAGAGGIVTTWDGGSAALGGRIVAAGDRRVHDAALRCLEQGARTARQ